MRSCGKLVGHIGIYTYVSFLPESCDIFPFDALSIYTSKRQTEARNRGEDKGRYKRDHCIF